MKVLASCRDVGASEHIVPLLYELERDYGCKVSLIIADPALSYNRQSLTASRGKIYVITEKEQADKEELEKRVQFIYDEVRPDVVLSGLSGPDEYSIDEALVSHSKVKSLYVQDFPGVLSNRLRKTPDIVLTVEESAAEYNRSILGLRSEAVGSIKHNRLARKISKLDIKERKEIIFFDQPLGHGWDYMRFMGMLKDEFPDIVIKLHPRRLLKSLEDDPAISMFSNVSTEDWTKLVRKSKIFASIFSTVCLDIIYLRMLGIEELPVPVFLDQCCRKSKRNMSDMENSISCSGALSVIPRIHLDELKGYKISNERVEDLNAVLNKKLALQKNLLVDPTSIVYRLAREVL